MTPWQLLTRKKVSLSYHHHVGGHITTRLRWCEICRYRWLSGCPSRSFSIHPRFPINEMPVQVRRWLGDLIKSCRYVHSRGQEHYLYYNDYCLEGKPVQLNLFVLPAPPLYKSIPCSGGSKVAPPTLFILDFFIVRERARPKSASEKWKKNVSFNFLI